MTYVDVVLVTARIKGSAQVVEKLKLRVPRENYEVTESVETITVNYLNVPLFVLTWTLHMAA